jgi:NADPH:quinone reductase
VLRSSTQLRASSRKDTQPPILRRLSTPVMTTMQTIHVSKPGPASVLELATVPVPSLASEHDVLVRVRAVALNPADTKVRSDSARGKAGTILGYDAAGVVEQAGTKAKFQKGDEVLYAGSVARPGTNAQYHVVDSRIVGRKPASIGWVDAAALPLVHLTAWEMLEDQFGLKPDGSNGDEVLIIINGAGGVGTAAIQLARKVSQRCSAGSDPVR